MDKRPLTDAELLEIIENFTFEDIPDDSQISTDIESDCENNDDIVHDKLQENDFSKENVFRPMQLLEKKLVTLRKMLRRKWE